MKDIYRYNYHIQRISILTCPADTRLSALVSKHCLETFLSHVECAFCRQTSHVANQRFATRWKGRTAVIILKNSLFILTVSITPTIGNRYKLRIAILTNVFDCLLIFFVLIRFLGIPVVDYFTRFQLITIGTCLKAVIAEAAEFDFASGFIDIPLP